MSLRIGVCGAGHLGKIHLNCLAESTFKLVGFYDPDPNAASKLAQSYNLQQFSSIDKLLESVDVVDIVSPTKTHFEIARKAIISEKHLFIEKPVCASVEEAEELKKLAYNIPVKIQVGHVERFNPVFNAIPRDKLQPRFIESHRLSMFNPRGSDVSVVLDLMIHDIDLCLNLVKSRIKDIRATGVSVINSTTDICNARIEFENECIANLTASRISMKNMRKFRIFQPDNYISLDLLNKKAQIIGLKDNASFDSNAMTINTQKGIRQLEIAEPEIKPDNAILKELNSFHRSIINDDLPEVSLEEAIEALSVAETIMEEIRSKQNNP